MTPDEEEAVRRFLAEGGKVRQLPMSPPMTAARVRRPKAAAWQKSKALKPGGYYS